MQEQVNEKTVSLIIRGSKLTGEMLQKALKKLLAEMEKRKHKGGKTEIYHGKQSIKDLAKQNAGLSNIEITDNNIKSFDRVARKYGVDYALKQDKSVDPPKWLVFFKARDADALTAAFNEFNAKKVKSVEKPSLLTSLNKLKDLIKNKVIDRVKKKDKGLEL